MKRGRFLVVDDDPLAARSVSRVLGAFGRVQVAASRRETRDVIERQPDWSAFVIDLRLPDGSGLEVLADVRERNRHARAAILSGAMDLDVLNAAFALDASCLCKPCPVENLRQLARDALTSERALPDRIGKAVRDLATKHALTRSQTEILLAAVRGLDRTAIAAARRVSENTHKTQVKDLLKKTRAMTLGELRDRVLQSVIRAEG